MATIQNLHLKLFRLWLEKENEKRRRHYQETWFQKYFVIWTIEAFSLKIPKASCDTTKGKPPLAFSAISLLTEWTATQTWPWALGRCLASILYMPVPGKSMRILHLPSLSVDLSKWSEWSGWSGQCSFLQVILLTCSEIWLSCGSVN